jgi:uncharacterized membrane protein YfcA
MKTLISLLLCLIFYYTSSAQSNSPKELTRDNYLHKSKVKKNIGYSFLGTGIILVITGAVIDRVKRPELLAGFGYEFIGVSSALISIPFFISSSKNERKALQFSLNTQKIGMLKQSVTSQRIQANITFIIK